MLARYDHDAAVGRFVAACEARRAPVVMVPVVMVPLMMAPCPPPPRRVPTQSVARHDAHDVVPRPVPLLADHIEQAKQGAVPVFRTRQLLQRLLLVARTPLADAVLARERGEIEAGGARSFLVGAVVRVKLVGTPRHRLLTVAATSLGEDWQVHVRFVVDGRVTQAYDFEESVSPSPPDREEVVEWLYGRGGDMPLRRAWLAEVFEARSQMT